jgi:transposase
MHEPAGERHDEVAELIRSLDDERQVQQREHGRQPETRHLPDHGQRSSHTSRVTRAWLAAHPRFKVTYTPKHASWLNMVEMWLSTLTRRLLRKGEFTSRDDLTEKIINVPACWHAVAMALHRGR